MRRYVTGARSGSASGKTLLVSAALCALILLFAQPSYALPYAFFEPAETLVLPTDEFELSFRVGDCGDSIASFQLYLSFDTELLELVEATEGSLYAESGEMTFFIEEEKGIGFYHFFDTLMGAGTCVLPPGELLHLRFRALDACGSSAVHIDTLRFTDVRRDPLPPAGYEDATVHVACSGAAGIPMAAVSLGPAAPNPFIASTEIPLSVPRGTADITLHVYDVRGRLVRSLNPNGGQGGAAVWDGRSDDGRDAPAGAYFLELRAGEGRARAKVLKLR